MYLQTLDISYTASSLTLCGISARHVLIIDDFISLAIYRKGDYHRYLAEFATGNDRKEAAENSLMAYKAASDIAMTELPPTHPIR